MPECVAVSLKVAIRNVRGSVSGGTHVFLLDFLFFLDGAAILSNHAHFFPA